MKRTRRFSTLTISLLLAAVMLCGLAVPGLAAGAAAAPDVVAAGGLHTLWVRPDGTARAVGANDRGQCNVAGWTDVIAVAAGFQHSVGLRSDGTVMAVGDDSFGQCQVGDWTDITAVAAGRRFTVGLRSDGTAVSVGQNTLKRCDVFGWKDIIAIAAGDQFTLGLRSDGTVIATGQNSHGCINIQGWTDIVAIAAGTDYSVGVRADGTVVTAGRNNSGRCDVSGWTDIVAVSAGKDHTVGLRADGTVVAAGNKGGGKCDVGTWKNVTAVAAGELHTVAVMADGSLAAVGYNDNGQCQVAVQAGSAAGAAAENNSSGAEGYLADAQKYLDAGDLYHARETLREGVKSCGEAAMEQHVFWAPAAELEMALRLDDEMLGWYNGWDGVNWDDFMNILSACSGRQAYTYLHGELLSFRGALPFVKEYIVYSFDDAGGKLTEMTVCPIPIGDMFARDTVLMENGELISNHSVLADADLMLNPEDDLSFMTMPACSWLVECDDQGRPTGAATGDTVLERESQGGQTRIRIAQGTRSNERGIDIQRDGDGRITEVVFTGYDGISGVELSYGSKDAIQLAVSGTYSEEYAGAAARLDADGRLLQGTWRGEVTVSYDTRGSLLRSDYLEKNAGINWATMESADLKESWNVEYDQLGRGKSFRYDTTWGERRSVLTTLTRDSDGRVCGVESLMDWWTTPEVDLYNLEISRDEKGLPASVVYGFSYTSDYEDDMMGSLDDKALTDRMISAMEKLIGANKEEHSRSWTEDGFDIEVWRMGAPEPYTSDNGALLWLSLAVPE